MTIKQNMKFLWVVLSLPWLTTGQVLAADPALELLDRMQSAVYDLNYTGQLVYSKGTELSTFQVSHQAGQEQENIIRLNQNDGSSSNQVESFSLSKFGASHPSGADAYTFDLGGIARVAEHDCQIVVVRPKDKMRYLQRYCIDPKSGLLLKYSLMDREQQVLEQLMFTQLTIEPEIKADVVNTEALNIVPNAAVPTPLVVAEKRVSTPTTQQVASATTNLTDLGGWQFENLPAGFKVVKNISQAENANVRQIVLSDGVASVSVFIAPETATKAIEQLSYSNGATHIMGVELAGHSITLVGEVPESTLQAIKKGLRYAAQ